MPENNGGKIFGIPRSEFIILVILSLVIICFIFTLAFANFNKERIRYYLKKNASYSNTIETIPTQDKPSSNYFTSGLDADSRKRFTHNDVTSIFNSHTYCRIIRCQNIETE